MSSMLEQAIIDANALREAAIKTAESNLIEKYSDHIKEAVETLLEQPDPLAQGDAAALVGAMGADLEAGEETEVGPLDGVPVAYDPETEGEDYTLTVNLEDLMARAEEEGAVGPDDVEDAAVPPADPMAALGGMPPDMPAGPPIPMGSPGEAPLPMPGGPMGLAESEDPNLEALNAFLQEGDLEEELEIDETQLASLVEKLVIDVANDPSGWMSRPEAHMRHAAEIKLAQQEDDDIKEELEAIKKAASSLKESNKKHKLANKKLKNKLNETLNSLKETKDIAYRLHDKLNESNLTNARLLFTNKVLKSASLNERQKTKIAEALTRAKTVEETKTIYETLQSAVGSTSNTPNRQPKSLSEVVRKSSTTVLPRKPEKKDPVVQDRWKILAGLD